jgi:ribonuclease-3 family protein
MAEFREEILRYFPQEKADIRSYSPLPLAFLGDAVYSLIIRTAVVSKGNRQAAKLHNETKRLVSAKAQAMVGDAIQEILEPEEARIYKRGLNSNPYHHAKNQLLSDYLKATALETLCGYLYLQDQNERLLGLIREGMERAGLVEKLPEKSETVPDGK